MTDTATAPTAITPEIVAARARRNMILKALGREPNLVELGIFSVMWSEHCSATSRAAST
jgi:phosphoribosylformylglycinamidine (FGAM) synthase-like enzyme